VQEKLEELVAVMRRDGADAKGNEEVKDQKFRGV
jgi:hypothetical protein